ncbi:MAG: hypothetical protein JWO78_1960 [Micavibrio sp.]|nr:hypothetical protein [Micavibrio sp.]
MGLTQQTLAGECDWDATYVSLLERGLRNPPFLSLFKMSKILKCRVSDLTDFS